MIHIFLIKIKPSIFAFLPIFALLIISGCKKQEEVYNPCHCENEGLFITPPDLVIDYTTESAEITLYNCGQTYITCDVEYDYNVVSLQYFNNADIAPGESVQVVVTPRWDNITNPISVTDIVYFIEGNVVERSKVTLQTKIPQQIKLPYNIVFAEYADWLDKIIAISSAPKNALLFIDPETGDKTELLLNKEPLCLRITPKLKKAAVGHDGYYSIIDLDSEQLLHHHSVPLRITGMILGTENWAYASGWGESYIYNLYLPDSSHTLNNYPSGSSLAFKVHPEENYMYATQTNSGSGGLTKYNISNGFAEEMYDAIIHYPAYTGRNFWFTDDTQYIFTCGSGLYSNSAYPDNDLKYVKHFGYEDKGIVGGVHRSNRNTLFTVTRTNNWSFKDDCFIEVIDDEYFNYIGRYYIYDKISASNPEDEYYVYPRYIFTNQTSNKVFLIMQGEDDENENDFFLFSYDF